MTVREILGAEGEGQVGTYDAPARQALVRMARYVDEFLTAAHPELGRTGVVCPFARRAIQQNQIHLTACDVSGEKPEDEALILEGMARLRGLLDGAGSDKPAHRAVVAVFPRLSEPHGARMIEKIQRALKLSFVQRQLMIGQFYPSCPEPGLWSAGFRPLQSPVISLAIRNITVFDAPFMLDRQEYVDAFVDTFGEAGAERIAAAVRDKRFATDPGACPRMAASAVAEARP
ncbi:DUF6875 domain-containing protein [Phenylobacterium deserti]|uniref:DUF6875 domain-containing protein n=1 Tax=Phenylobacterium deserti TaxID=1914756 RepID=UPI00105832A7|nr:hypothetical protein [Phenylobacterium deserti]